MSTGSSGGVTVERGQPPFFSSPLVMAKNLVRNRFLIRHFVHRDFKVKYHNSILGYGWALLEPLVLTGVFYLLFAILSQSVDPYRPLHIMVGIITWYYFQQTVEEATTSLTNRSGIIQVVYFPREVFIISIAFFKAIVLILSILVVIPMIFYYDLTPNWRIIFLPFSLIMIGLFATGIGFFTSVLQTRIRDVSHIVNLITRIGFFLSPVFFTLKTMSRVPEQYLEIYLFVNPMAVYLEMVRSSITGLPLGIGLPHIVSAFIVPLIVFYLGSIFFMRKERKAVKYL